MFVYWLCSLSCDTLCILDTMMVMPYTRDNGKFAWEEQTQNCTQPLVNPGGNISRSHTYLSTNHLGKFLQFFIRDIFNTVVWNRGVASPKQLCVQPRSQALLGTRLVIRLCRLRHKQLSLYGYVDLDISNYVSFISHDRSRLTLNPSLLLQVPLCRTTTFKNSYFNSFMDRSV